MIETRPSEGRKPLRSVHGPTAFSSDGRRLLSLTWLIARTQFQLAYYNSVLGPLWTLMRPLMLFGVLYVVFSQIIDFGSGITDYPVVLLLNIVLFSFFQEATATSVPSLVERESLLRKMQFPRIAIPLSTVLTACMNMALNLVAVIVFLLAYGVDPRWTWLLLPLVLLPLAAFATGAGMLLSSLYVRFRDIAPIWSVVSTMLFYATPVLYAIETVPDDFERYVLFNPIACLLEQARHWMIDPEAQGAVTAIGGWGWALVPIGVGVGIVALGTWVFHKEAPGLAERL
jgi:ABC-2 type transport system permease protein